MFYNHLINYKGGGKMIKRLNIISSMNSEKFKDLVLSSQSQSEIMRKLGLVNTGNSTKILKRRLEKENIDISFFKEIQRKKQSERAKMTPGFGIKKPVEDYLVDGSKISNTTLKVKLIESGLLKECCAECGLGNNWNGKNLVLQLDHINGKNDDNRLSNLRLLCPNCHTQTETFAGRRFRTINNCTTCGIVITRTSTRCVDCCRANNAGHKRKVARPSKVELERLIQSHSFLYLSKQYGVSDNAIRKWCKYYNLPYRKKDIEECYKK